MTSKRICFILCMFLLGACQTKKHRNTQLSATDTTIFAEGTPVLIDNPEIGEASGLAVSGLNPGKIWIHNDSGGKAFLYLIDTLGHTVGKVQLLGVENHDWEDMAIVRNKRGAWVYIADTGDNFKWHSEKTILRFEEPLFTPDSPFFHQISTIDKITFELPDGGRDIECLMVDPLTSDIFMISNRETRKEIYLLSAPHSTSQVQSARFVGYLPVSGELSSDSKKTRESLYVTSGNISPDGQEIVIKNYVNIFYWKRNPKESIAQTLARIPTVLPYKPEPQGEAIAFAPDAHAYYSSGERTYQAQPVYLYCYARKMKKSLSKKE